MDPYRPAWCLPGRATPPGDWRRDTPRGFSNRRPPPEPPCPSTVASSAASSPPSPRCPPPPTPPRAPHAARSWRATRGCPRTPTCARWRPPSRRRPATRGWRWSRARSARGCAACRCVPRARRCATSRAARCWPGTIPRLAAVAELDVGTANLQQCADSIIRLHAEWLWSQGQKERIAYRFTSGHLASWPRYAAGDRARDLRLEGDVGAQRGGGRLARRRSARTWTWSSPTRARCRWQQRSSGPRARTCGPGTSSCWAAARATPCWCWTWR